DACDHVRLNAKYETPGFIVSENPHWPPAPCRMDHYFLKLKPFKVSKFFAEEFGHLYIAQVLLFVDIHFPARSSPFYFEIFPGATLTGVDLVEDALKEHRLF